MATMNVSLPDKMKTWAEGRVSSGRYANLSDYVRDLIRRDQAGEEELQALRAALAAGEESGLSPRSVEDVYANARAAAEARARDA